MLDDSPKAVAVLVLSALAVLIVMRKTFGSAALRVG